MPRKKTKKDAVRRFAVLFGFDVGNKDQTGYLRVGETGYTIVENRRDATEFTL